MSTSTRRRALGTLALAALIGAACSDSDLPMEAASATAPAAPSAASDDGTTREAAAAEDWTVPADKGGNGTPTTRKTENDCFTGLYESSQMICFVLMNNTTRLTATQNVTAKFPLTVARYFAANGNVALGGDGGGGGTWGYDGSMAVSGGQDWDCGAACAGRLTPNPFLESAIMQFQSWNTWRGANVRIIATSEVSPLGGVQRGAEMQYDSPKWSNTNYSECRNGDYLTCREVSIPSSGGRSKPVYEIGTRPMDISLNFTGAPAYTLIRQGPPVTSGFMLDPAVESANSRRLAAGERARYGGYRATGDQSTASFLVTYVVGNADGVTDPAVCEAAATRVLGCGSQIIIEVGLDKDGNATTTTGLDKDGNATPSNRCQAINRTFQSRFSCKTPSVSGTNDGVKLVRVDIADTPIR